MWLFQKNGSLRVFRPGGSQPYFSNIRFLECSNFGPSLVTFHAPKEFPPRLTASCPEFAIHVFHARAGGQIDSSHLRLCHSREMRSAFVGC
jgi:hypothetical protein